MQNDLNGTEEAEYLSQTLAGNGERGDFEKIPVDEELKGLPLFLYGTLMCPDVYLRVVSRGNRKVKEFPPSEVATLHKFQRRIVKGCKYPAVYETGSELDSVQGILLYPRSGEVIWLDDWEKPEYERRIVQVESQGKVMKCWIYVWIRSIELLDDKDWDYKDFLHKHLQSWLERNQGEELDGMGYQE